MKKIGLAAASFILLMSCNGGANDGKAGTDTTTFPSNQRSDTATKGLGDMPDSSDRMPDTMFKNPKPTTRPTTPGSHNGKDSTRR